MRIGFLNNQIDNRGTGNAVFDYAHYNETLLGNKSVILTFPYGSHDIAALTQYQRRFGSVYNIHLHNRLKLDALYHIKSGYDDGFRPDGGIPYLVHSVFENHPHGDRYATVSPWMGQRFNLPYVPHIINLPDTSRDLRGEFGIPDSAIVFGRHGGPDTFDISWAWNAVKRASEKENIWFLFMNTNRPDMDFNGRVLFLEPTSNRVQKREFINTCDAMIHARERGETFGMAVGEFASLGKPVITYGYSGEKNHYLELDEYGLYYYSEAQLDYLLQHFTPNKLPSLYNYSPELVMKNFREVFLNGIDTGSRA